MTLESLRIEIDRLVDGELNDDQRRHLLRACEGHSGRWRDVALAFVESQVLSSDVHAIVVATGGSRVAPLAKSQSAKRRSLNVLALAASMMLMLAVGYQVGQERTSTLVGRSEEPPAVAGTTDQSDGSLDHSASETVQVVMFDSHANELRSVPVELTPEAQLPVDFFQRHSESISVFRDQLLKAGHKLQHEQRFVPVRLPDNRMGIIPMDRYRVIRDQYQ